MGFKVGEHFVFAAGLFGGMLQDFDAGDFFEEAGFGEVFVGGTAGSVGDYKELGAWVGSAEGGEFGLGELGEDQEDEEKV